jgi:hypothetical protein
MPYELVNELKNAAYPLALITSAGFPQISSAVEIDGLFYQFPILEELIEGCGEDFLDLHFNGKEADDSKKWEAWGYKLLPITGEDDKRGRGSTPIEAVARLWLALNASPQKAPCCEKCWHINTAHPTSRDYCSDTECDCHKK